MAKKSANRRRLERKIAHIRHNLNSEDYSDYRDVVNSTKAAIRDRQEVIKSTKEQIAEVSKVSKALGKDAEAKYQQYLKEDRKNYGEISQRQIPKLKLSDGRNRLSSKSYKHIDSKLKEATEKATEKNKNLRRTASISQANLADLSLEPEFNAKATKNLITRAAYVKLKDKYNLKLNDKITHYGEWPTYKIDYSEVKPAEKAKARAEVRKARRRLAGKDASKVAQMMGDIRNAHEGVIQNSEQVFESVIDLVMNHEVNEDNIADLEHQAYRGANPLVQ